MDLSKKLWYYSIGDIMDNKKNAIIVAIFIIIFMIIAGIIGISGKLPVIGKISVFIFAILLVLFVLVFFIILAKRRK